MDQGLAELLSGVFDMRVADISPELTRDDIGSWDSLRQLDLVMSLEKAYGIELGIEDILRLISVEAIAAVLVEKGVSIAH